MADLEYHLDQIHSKLMLALFKSEPKQANMEDDLINDNDSTESFVDEPQAPVRVSYIVEKILEVARTSDFSSNPKLKALVDEFLDLLESEYFESALYEILESSFTLHMKTPLISNLTQ